MRMPSIGPPLVVACTIDKCEAIGGVIKTVLRLSPQGLTPVAIDMNVLEKTRDCSPKK
jgi:hypothetical protein